MYANFYAIYVLLGLLPLAVSNGLAGGRNPNSRSNDLVSPPPGGWIGDWGGVGCNVEALEPRGDF